MAVSKKAHFSLKSLSKTYNLLCSNVISLLDHYIHMSMRVVKKLNVNRLNDA